jgi:hypothetical protein
MRITDTELTLIKNAFADNDELLKVVRKAFFQMELTDEDIKNLSVLGNDAMLSLLRKIFLPEIDAYMPIGQNIDLWMTIDVKEKEPYKVLWELQGRAKVIDAVEAGLARVKIPYKEGREGIRTFTPNLLPSLPEATMVDLIARNTIITHVEQQLFQLKVLAGMKQETVEETKTRLSKDSSK